MDERANASLLLDRNLEAGRAARPAIYFGGTPLTYRGLFELTCRYGGALEALGAARGDRVLLVLDDHPAFPALFLGAIRIGAVPVPLNPFYDADHFRYFAEDSGARLVIADPARLDRVREGAGTVDGVRVLVAGDAGAPDSIDEIARDLAGSLAPASTRPDDMAFWLYSSGSTGRPKAVIHQQDHILTTCEAYARHILEVRESDVTFSTTKLFHAYGLGNSLSFPCWAGAASVLLAGRPTPAVVFDTIGRYRPTLFFSVPTLYNAMLKTESGGRDLSSIRRCISAAEALPPPVWDAWKRSYGLEILDGVGSTEMLHIYCSNRPTAIRPGSSGQPVPGYRLRVLDDEGREADTEVAGDLWVSGASQLAGYWNQPERTAAVLRDGWLFSGDRYTRDADGYYWYRGRADDMFKVHGLWVSPVEVEAVLMEHPGVLEAAVVGAAIDGFVQAKAFVVAREPQAAGQALREELRAHCERRLHGFQRPGAIMFVPDLPHTMTGKIQRFRLREQAGTGT